MPITVTLLADRPDAVSDVLQARGWEIELSRETAAGVASAALHVSGVGTEVIEAMLSITSRLGIQMLTGPDWLMLIGPHSRLGAFARPWVQPLIVQELAIAIGMAMPPDDATTWRHARGLLSLEQPAIMGILNVTPDSFSDGGLTSDSSGALRRAGHLLEGGAVILDIGGESTRPGAVAVPEEEEIRRVVPIIGAIVKEFPDAILSIDTVKSGVARVALDAGAAIINDVTAGRHDRALPGVAASHGAGLVLSHSRGALEQIASLPIRQDPANANSVSGTDQAHDFRRGSFAGQPTDAGALDIVSAVTTELKQSWQAARDSGVVDDRVVLDPGIGFGKDLAENLALIDQLGALLALGRPVMVGPSRKRFLGQITGRSVLERDSATAAACALAVDRGARIVRVHEPAAVRDAIAVAAAMKRRPS